MPALTELFHISEEQLQRELKRISNTMDKYDPPEIDTNNDRLQMDQILRDLNIPLVELIRDGKIHRCQVNGRSDESGWYAAYSNGITVAGNWAQGTKVEYKTHYKTEPTPEQMQTISRQREESSKATEEQQKRIQAEVAQKAKDLWNSYKEASEGNPYLLRKGIKPHGERQDQHGNLVVDYRNQEGEITTLQYIQADGSKCFLTGGKKKGSFHKIGEGEPVYMAEGDATAASIYEATGKAVIAAGDAGNLLSVAPLYPVAIIVADNDESQTGEIKAKASGNKYILIPERGMDANDYASNYGLDVLRSVLEGSEPQGGSQAADQTHYNIIEGGDLLCQLKPREEFIKHWIGKHELIVIWGASGSGKTFLSLDMALHMATKQLDWHGYKCKGCNVLYSSGEGILAIRKRISLWCQEYLHLPYRETQAVLNSCFRMPNESIQLDDSTGYDKIREAIRAQAPWKHDVIVIDTVSRHMKGEENSNDDVRNFLNKCEDLINEFDCSVVLIHHSGHENSEHSRGASTFRANVDREFRVTAQAGRILRIDQIKNKDDECIVETCFKREIAALDPWKDADGSIVESWKDEDGDTQTSCYLVPTDAPEEELDPKTEEAMEQADGYVQQYGQRNDDGDLIISHEDLRKARQAYYRQTMGDEEYKIKGSTRASQDLSTTDKAMAKKNFVARLIDCKFWQKIQGSKQTPTGWKILDQDVINRWETAKAKEPDQLELEEAEDES